jgi:hypothetical protein
MQRFSLVHSRFRMAETEHQKQAHNRIHRPGGRAALGAATLSSATNFENDVEVVRFYQERLERWARGPEGKAFLAKQLGPAAAKEFVDRLAAKNGIYEGTTRKAIELFQQAESAAGRYLKVDGTIGFRTDHRLEAALARIQPVAAGIDPNVIRAAKAGFLAATMKSKPQAQQQERQHVVGGLPLEADADQRFMVFLKSVPAGNPYVQQARYQHEKRELTQNDINWWNTKVKEFERHRSIVATASPNNPAVSDLLRRIDSAQPLTEKETKKFAQSVSAYEQVLKLAKALDRHDPTYRTGLSPQDSSKAYFDGLFDRSKFHVKVGQGKDGEVNHIVVHKVGNVPLILQDDAHYPKTDSLKRSLGYAQGSTDYEGLYQHMVIRVSNELLGGTDPAALARFTDTLRHELGHAYKGFGEHLARAGEKRFAGTDDKAKFKEIMCSPDAYSRESLSRAIAESFISKGAVYVNGVPNPTMLSWFGGSDFQGLVGEVRTSHFQAPGSKPAGTQGGQVAASSPENREAGQKFEELYSKGFDLKNPEVQAGIREAFIRAAQRPFIEQFAGLPALPLEQQKELAPIYRAKYQEAKKAGEAEADKFFKAAGVEARKKNFWFF